MRDLIVRPKAKADLNELCHHIAERSGSEKTAISYIVRIEAWWEVLRTFPEIGRLRNDLRQDTRILGFERRIVIAYKILPSGDVEIGRVFYGGQNYEALIRDDH